MANYKTRATIYEVAKASGFSLATVSRVINRKNNVSEKTKQKVMETIARLGYKPSALAQGLATSKSTNIGLVLPSKNYIYLSNAISGMSDIAKIYGYQTTLFFTKPTREEMNETLERIIMSHVDGVIFFDDVFLEEDFIELSNYKIPMVIIGKNITGENIASIILDYTKALQECIQQHYKFGNEPLYFLHVENPGILMGNIEKTVEEEMKKKGYEKDFHILKITDEYDEAYEEIYEFLKKEKVGFFIAPRDSLSCAVANAALDLNIKIPDDIQILSVINTKYSKIMRPKLSSLSLDMYEIGSIAMRMMTKLLNSSLNQKTYFFTAEIIHRQSSRN